MKKCLYLALLVALGGGLAMAQTMPSQRYPGQTTPPTIPDNQPPAAQTHTPPADPAAVQNDIQSSIQKDPTLANSNVSVQVTDKNVELTGSVPNKDAKKTAEKIAKDHSGGLDVKNHLKVEKTPGTGDQSSSKDH